MPLPTIGVVMERLSVGSPIALWFHTQSVRKNNYIYILFLIFKVIKMGLGMEKGRSFTCVNTIGAYL